MSHVSLLLLLNLCHGFDKVGFDTVYNRYRVFLFPHFWWEEHLELPVCPSENLVARWKMVTLA